MTDNKRNDALTMRSWSPTLRAFLNAAVPAAETPPLSDAAPVPDDSTPALHPMCLPTMDLLVSTWRVLEDVLLMTTVAKDVSQGGAPSETDRVTQAVATAVASLSSVRDWNAQLDAWIALSESQHTTPATPPSPPPSPDASAAPASTEEPTTPTTAWYFGPADQFGVVAGMLLGNCVVPPDVELDVYMRITDALQAATGATLYGIECGQTGDDKLSREGRILSCVDTAPMLQAFARKTALRIKHLWPAYLKHELLPVGDYLRHGKNATRALALASVGISQQHARTDAERDAENAVLIACAWSETDFLRSAHVVTLATCAIGATVIAAATEETKEDTFKAVQTTVGRKLDEDFLEMLDEVRAGRKEWTFEGPIAELTP